MKISRRQLATTAAGIVPLSLLSKMAWARGRGGLRLESDPDTHFFLFVQAYGAWDVCLAFDPKNREALLPNGEKQFDQPYSIDEVRDFGGIPLPPAGQVLGKYADRLAIVNGIDMEVDGGHTPDIMMTGNQTARAANAPYVQAMLAKYHSFLKKRSVPHLYTSYDGQFIGGPYGMSSIAAAPGDFLSVVGSGDSENASTQALKTLVDEYQAALPSAGARRTFGSYVGAVDSALAVTKALKDFGFEPPTDIEAPAGVGSFIGQLFASGVLGSATLSLGGKYFFDTHSDHYATHPLGQVLTDLDLVMQALAAIPLDATQSVLDRTTVIFTAEYARTPRLNTFNGKDHNFRTNSLAAIGYKVRPGVYGQSGARLEGSIYEGHAALPIDFATGKPDPQGQILYAKNLWAGIGGMTGVDISGEFPSGTAPIRFLG